MKKLSLLLMLLSSLSTFSLDGIIDSISNKVADSVGNKVSESIDTIGSGENKDKTSNQTESQNTKFDKLKELVKMRENGYITKNEYIEAKKQLFSQ